MSSHAINAEQWAKLDRLNQLGNIGSEVGRALKAKRQGQQQRMEAAFYRGMDLINTTIDIWVEQKQSGMPELLVARELFAESVLTDKEDLGIEEYFMQYAVAARMRQFK